MGILNNRLLLLELIILVSFISGCVYDKNVTSTVNAIPEVQQFLKEHPDAKIAVTFWSKEEVTNSEQEISQQCDKKIVPADMFKSTISEGNLKTIIWINAQNLTVICSNIEETPVTPSPTSSFIVTPASSPIITPSSPSSVPSPQTTSIPTATPGTVSVVIKNFAFDPSTITIPTGTTVIWTQMDSVDHTVTGSSFDSGTLSQGQTFRRTFYDAGTYSYSCSIHPTMIGTVIVTETFTPSPTGTVNNPYMYNI